MNLLLIGPLPHPITGVSLANQVVLANLPNQTKTQVSSINTNYKSFTEDIGKFSVKKTISSVKQYSNILRILSADKVYLTPGQTFLGIVKYLPYFIFAKLFKKEIIIHIHGNHLWKEYESLRGIKKKLFQKIISMSDKGIVLSPSLKKNLTPFIACEQIYILENFVEDFLYDPKLQKNYDCLRIIYLSNLMQEKGIVDLLDAFLLLKKQGIIFQAQIAGSVDDSTKARLNSYYNLLADNVSYLGVVQGDEKKKLLEWGNVFVFPTYYAMEGQPIAIFEAMATGNIILTTMHAGIPDVFQDKINGFYIDKKSPSSIAERLSEISEDMNIYKAISENNRKEAREKYRVNIFIHKLYSILVDKTCKS